MMIPPVTTGSWSAWISVSPETGGRVAPELSWLRSSVSTAVVRKNKMKSLSELRGFSYTSLLLPHEKSGMVENIYNTDKNRVVCVSYKPKIKLRVL